MHSHPPRPARSQSPQIPQELHSETIRCAAFLIAMATLEIISAIFMFTTAVAIVVFAIRDLMQLAKLFAYACVVCSAGNCFIGALGLHGGRGHKSYIRGHFYLRWVMFPLDISVIVIQACFIAISPLVAHRQSSSSVSPSPSLLLSSSTSRSPASFTGPSATLMALFWANLGIFLADRKLTFRFFKIIKVWYKFIPFSGT